MVNIEPWCISRQIWWGHRIPVWYGNDGKIFAAESEKDAEKLAKAYYKNKTYNLIYILWVVKILELWVSSVSTHCLDFRCFAVH